MAPSRTMTKRRDLRPGTVAKNLTNRSPEVVRQSKDTPQALRRLQHPSSLRGAFVREFLIDMNATNAAIRAGYPPHRARDMGAALRKVPMVRDAIERAMAERARRVGLTADRVLDMLGRMALGNPKAVLNEDGTVKAPHELDDDDAMMIAGVKTRRIVEINPDTGKMHNAEIQEVRLIDRTAVLNLVMRHLGMNNDRITLDVGGTLAEQLEAAVARREGGDTALTPEDLTDAEVAMVEDAEAKMIEDAEYEIVEGGDEEEPDGPVTDEDLEALI